MEYMMKNVFWFEVELQELKWRWGKGICEAEVFQSYNDDNGRGDTTKSNLSSEQGTKCILPGILVKTVIVGDNKLERFDDVTIKVACEVISKWKAGLKDDMDARSDVYVLNNGCKKCSDDSDCNYLAGLGKSTQGSFITSFSIYRWGTPYCRWRVVYQDCDVEKNGKWSCINAVEPGTIRWSAQDLDISKLQMWVCISQNFSYPCTTEQNGVAERRNITLIEAARTMLNSAKLPKQFWGEAVNTACYTQNRSIIGKMHGKTAYDVFRGRAHDISYSMCLGVLFTFTITGTT
ncbi:retrovirus-related pol polyprotein from transposon TNT 1-94 [Tanacetum coccineum]